MMLPSLTNPVFFKRRSVGKKIKKGEEVVSDSKDRLSYKCGKNAR